jgi:hypothetical protein
MTYERTEREDPDFARGQDRPDEFPGTKRSAASPRARRAAPRRGSGRFSEGEEELPEEDPEKHAEGSFGEEE